MSLRRRLRSRAAGHGAVPRRTPRSERARRKTPSRRRTILAKHGKYIRSIKIRRVKPRRRKCRGFPKQSNISAPTQRGRRRPSARMPVCALFSSTFLSGFIGCPPAGLPLCRSPTATPVVPFAGRRSCRSVNRAAGFARRVAAPPVCQFTGRAYSHDAAMLACPSALGPRGRAVKEARPERA